jgi:hypothetical protein
MKDDHRIRIVALFAFALIGLLSDFLSAASKNLPQKVIDKGPLTVEQQAYFGMGATADPKLWSFFSKPSAQNLTVEGGSQRIERFHYIFKWGHNDDVCLTWHKNQELWGGALKGGCTRVLPSPKLSHLERLSFPIWREVNARDHIDIIRDSFLAAQGNRRAQIFELSSSPKYNGPYDPGGYWRLMAPIVKRLLEQGQIRMAEAAFDVDNGGKKQNIFAITFLPVSECLDENKARASDYTYLFMDGSSVDARSFNEEQFSGNPFIYDGHTYFPASDGVRNISAQTPGTGEWKVTSWSVCEFDEK